MSPYWNADIIKYKIIEGVKCNPDIILTFICNIQMPTQVVITLHLKKAATAWH